MMKNVLMAITLTGAALLTTACAPPSFLVTPVFTKTGLVETELTRESFFAMDKIALIEVSGLLTNAPQFKLLGQGEHPVGLLVEQLDKARQDASVKAVILKIHSPGGTVTASQLMHDEIMHFRKRSQKPITAVLMDVAASGGYYIACACDEIVAQPSTVTGSIGVIMQMFDVSGTMKMIGVQADAITTGPYKDAGSPFRELLPAEREVFQSIVNGMYEQFLTVVEKGRCKLSRKRIQELADGRVYLASQALEAGLIDRIASPREVIKLVKKKNHLHRVRVVTYHRPLENRANFYASYPQSPSMSFNLLNIESPTNWFLSPPQFLYLWQPGVQ